MDVTYNRRRKDLIERRIWKCRDARVCIDQSESRSVRESRPKRFEILQNNIYASHLRRNIPVILPPGSAAAIIEEVLARTNIGAKNAFEIPAFIAHFDAK